MYSVWALVATFNILDFAMAPYNLPEIKGLCERFLLHRILHNIIVFCDAE